MKALVNYFIIFELLISYLCAQTSGTLIDDSFFSVSLNSTKNVDVYVPPDYYTNSTRHYPVIYFLHGAGTNNNDYSYLKGELDNLINNATIQPVIFVKPDASVGPYLGSFYTNSVLYGNYENYIADDLVQYIDATYRTVADKSKRSMMGHSMGAYGAMKLLINHPGTFIAAAAHSGPLDLNSITDGVPDLLAENGGSGPYDPNAGLFSGYMYSMAGAFSPNLSNSPEPVDLPVDNSGITIPSVLNKWLTFSPAQLAMQNPAFGVNAIYFDCGRQDEFYLYDQQLTFADTLDLLGINYTFKSYNGDHNNKIPDRFLISIPYLDSVMQNTDLSLPVDLSSFRAAWQNGKVVLSWRTESETENLGFTVLRRDDFNAAFMPIAGFESDQRLVGRMNSSSATDYEYIDSSFKGKTGGSFEYRLQSKNLDGSVENYSQTAIVNIPDEVRIHKVFPNPFNAQITIQFITPESGEAHLSLFNLLGKRVLTEKIPIRDRLNSITLNLGDEAGSGKYFYRLEFNQRIHYGSLLLIK